MSKIVQILQAIIQTEENILPIFIHNPKSQQIEAVIIAAESAVAGILSQLGATATTTPATGGK